MNPVTTTRSPAVTPSDGAPRAALSVEPTRYREKARDGVELSLLRFAGDVRCTTPVLLTHGTFSNAQVCAKLASFLADHGLEAWILELRGHGQSQAGDGDPDFQHLADFDVPAALAAVRRCTQRPHVFLVGHSGGGLIFLMHLARQPATRQHVKGLVTLASQATEAATKWSGKVKVVSFAALNNLLGYLPGPAFGLGPENEWRGVMNEWFRWNWRRRWLGRDGFDYDEALRDLEVPILCLAGAGDRFIAPVRGCRRVYEALGSKDKRLVICGTSEGFSEDYGHARIIASRGARQEIWPLILSWIRERV